MLIHKCILNKFTYPTYFKPNVHLELYITKHLAYNINEFNNKQTFLLKKRLVKSDCNHLLKYIVFIPKNMIFKINAYDKFIRQTILADCHLQFLQSDTFAKTRT